MCAGKELGGRPFFAGYSIVVFGLLFAAFHFSEGAREHRHAVRNPIIVASLLELAKIGSGDVIYDLERRPAECVTGHCATRYTVQVSTIVVAARVPYS